MIGYGRPVACEARNVELRGTTRFSHLWIPTNEAPWAALTITHGFGAHGGRFAGLGTSLASMGIALNAIDLVGHGRSPGRRGCIESFDQLLDEVEASLEHAEELFANTPQFLFGQSMGGNLALNLVLRRPDFCDRLHGVIAGSPMLRPAKMPKERIMDAGRWLAKKVPNLRIKASVEVSKLSQDRRAQDEYLRDRYCHSAMSLRLAANIVDSGLWAIENASKLEHPVLLMYGSDDTLVCPNAIQEFANAATDFAQVKVWTGCRHELHEDIQRERMFAYLSAWMKRQCTNSFNAKAFIKTLPPNNNFGSMAA